MKKNILFLSLLLFSAPLVAQTPFWYQTNGPEGGTVENITIDSLGRVIVWTAGSGVFRSNDTGNSWSLLNRGLPKAQVYLGAYTTTGYLIVSNAAADGQVFRLKENDPNALWEEITPYKGNKSVLVNDILADSDGSIYLALGSLGILRSVDNGTTWVEKGILTDTNHLVPLQLDQNARFLSADGNGNIFVILAGYGAIFRTSDKGSTWKKLPIRCPDGYKAIFSFLAAPNGNIIVGTQQRTLTIGGHIYVSTYLNNNDTTWVSKYQRPANSDDQKNNIDRLIRVPGTNVIYANAHGATLRSPDNGTTWAITDTNKRGDEVFAMVAKGNNLFQMCEPDGIFLSTDNGATWTPKNKGVYAEYMWGVAVNSKQHIFAITEYGLWGSTDNGDSWDHKPEYGEDYHPSLWIDKKDSIFIGTNKGLFRSGDEGQTLAHIIIHAPDSLYPTASDSLGGNTIEQVGDNGRGKLFCAGSDTLIGFLYSFDEGNHWGHIPKLPQQNQIITGFAFASFDTVLATSNTVGTSNFYLSTDTGTVWRLLSQGPSNPTASQILIHPDGSYLARVRGAFGGIYRSVDLARTWTRIFPGEGTKTFKDYYYMMIDHSGNVIVCTDSGVYRSTDATLSLWYSVSEGLSAHDVPGHFITCAGVAENLVTHVYFAATKGLGVFKSIPLLGVSQNNSSPLSALGIHIYPNPSSASANISFTMPSRSDVTMELFDILGRKVRTIFNGILDEGEKSVLFDGSSLSSGTYMLLIQAAGKSYTSQVTLSK